MYFISNKGCQYEYLGLLINVTIFACVRECVRECVCVLSLSARMYERNAYILVHVLFERFRTDPKVS